MRYAVLVGLAVIAVGVSYLAQKRRPDPPTSPSYRAPSQLDLADFETTAKSNRIIVFGSTTCASCESVWSEVAGFESETVAVQLCNVEDDSALHDRYKIDGVPTTLVVDASGVVQHAYFGPLTSGVLESDLAADD